MVGVLIVPVAQHTWGGSLIYDPAINTWAAGPTLANGIYWQAEAAWVKLPDSSILTIDPGATSSERYIPSTNTWASDSTLPVDIYNNFEMGTGILLPNGKVFFLGGTGHTILYTPSGTTSPGSWTAGPDIPNSQGTLDAPATMMPNGKVLCIVSPLPTTNYNYTTPTSFYEYDYTTNSFAQVNGPFGPTDNRPTYPTFMLDLPDGTVLYSRYGGQLYVYQPTGVVLAAGKPTISSVTKNSDGSYHLTGTLLNGISEGASYGDDAQMGTNYPIVRLSNSNGQVYYTWTYNWNSTGVMTGSTLQTTEFTLPANLPSGTYSLEVVANGIASDPISFDTRAHMASPVPGRTFNSSTVTFSWTKGYANGYALWVGSSPSSSDIYHGGQILNTVGTVSNIPTDGRNIYVRLWSLVGNSWLYIDYTYRALAGPPRSTPKADFNGDGKSDIVWQDNSAGERAIWFMNGTTYAGGVDFGRIPLEWKIASTADFNGDGKTDIVWQNASTGTCSIWFMNGTSKVGTVDIAHVPIEWQIAATGDFNGDGQTDILWQNTSTGERAIWFMNGASYSSGVSLGFVPTQWRIVGAGDFSGDGQTDILWQNTLTGIWAIWFMNGASYSGGIGFGPIPLQWQIAGTGDFNSDGNPDILWQNISTRERAIWLMQGSTHSGSASLGTAPVQWEMRNH